MLVTFYVFLEIMLIIFNIFPLFLLIIFSIISIFYSTQTLLFTRLTLNCHGEAIKTANIKIGKILRPEENVDFNNAFLMKLLGPCTM